LLRHLENWSVRPCAVGDDHKLKIFFSQQGVMMRILVTGVGGAAAISVWKVLKDAHELYMGDIDCRASGLYLVPQKYRLLLPAGTDPEFSVKILEICKQLDINLLIATVDAELEPLALRADEFAAAGIKVPLCSPEVLRLCRDKYALLTAAQKVVPVPNYVILTKETLQASHAFPLFAKPRFGAGSNGIFTLKNQQDLANLPLDGSYLIQELLPGEEYSVDVYIHSEGTALAAVPRLRMKVDSGVAVTARTQQLPELIDAALKLAQHVGIRYVANIQFKRALDGQFKLLEINPRFAGALPLTVAAGINLPQLLLDDVQGKKFARELLPFKELMMVRYWQEHFFSPKEWEILCQL
jgi:carbamoyl-phosphate synthase large subunit